MKQQSFFYSWKQFSRPQLSVLITYFFVYFLLRLQLRLSSSLLNDEQVTTGGLHLPFVQWITEYLPRSDYHFATSYLVLYPVGHWISLSPFILCIPYAIISCLFYFVFVKVNWPALLNLSPKDPVISPIWLNIVAAVLVTHNATQIEHAFAVRPYGSLSLLAVFALCLSMKVLTSDRFRLSYVLGIAVLSVYHNYGVMMIFYSTLYIFARYFILPDTTLSGEKVKMPHLAAILTMVTGFALAAPLWLYYVNSTVLQALNITAYDPAVHTLVHYYIKPGIKGVTQVAALYYGFKPFRLMLFAVMLVGVFYFIRKRKWQVLLFPICLVILPTAVIYLFARLSNYWFIQRTFIWVMPFHAVFVSAAMYAAVNWMACKLLPGRSKLEM